MDLWPQKISLGMMVGRDEMIEKSCYGCILCVGSLTLVMVFVHYLQVFPYGLDKRCLLLSLIFFKNIF